MAVPRDEFWIRWSGGQTGTRYDLVVTTPQFEEIVDERGLDATEYRVPPERLKQLPSGTRLLWRVNARSIDGGTVSSPTYEVTIR